MKTTTIFLLVSLLSSLLYADKRLQLTIEYAGIYPNQSLEVEYKEGESVLAILQSAVKVTTKKVGKYIFVKSIKGVKAKPNKMGWFYTVDGQRAKVTASNKKLYHAKSMIWTFQVDSCLR